MKWRRIRAKLRDFLLQKPGPPQAGGHGRYDRLFVTGSLKKWEKGSGLMPRRIVIPVFQKPFGSFKNLFKRRRKR